MLREEGRVVEEQGTLALVAGERHQGCGSCAAQSGCSMLGGGAAQRETRFLASNPLQARVGQRVQVEISSGQFLGASFRVYMLPVLLFIAAGAAVRALLLATGFSLGAAEGFGALGALAGLGAGLWMARQHGRRLEADDNNRPRIVAVMDPGEQPVHFVRQRGGEAE
ncbi:MAG: SoxR reducing system RseC family protein [Magnetococcus sp. WYHC-3]